VTGDVTGSELAEVCQQSYMSVMGCNSMDVPHRDSLPTQMPGQAALRQ